MPILNEKKITVLSWTNIQTPKNGKNYYDTLSTKIGSGEPLPPLTYFK